MNVTNRNWFDFYVCRRAIRFWMLEVGLYWIQKEILWMKNRQYEIDYRPHACSAIQSNKCQKKMIHHISRATNYQSFRKKKSTKSSLCLEIASNYVWIIRNGIKTPTKWNRLEIKEMLFRQCNFEELITVILLVESAQIDKLFSRWYTYDSFC